MIGKIELLQETVQRGKYARLYNYLSQQQGDEWRVTFGRLEQILDFKLPNSARIHRAWWANQRARGSHSHALAWEMAGWMTTQVDMAGETIVFVRAS